MTTVEASNTDGIEGTGYTVLCIVQHDNTMQTHVQHRDTMIYNLSRVEFVNKDMIIIIEL